MSFTTAFQSHFPRNRQTDIQGFHQVPQVTTTMNALTHLLSLKIAQLLHRRQAHTWAAPCLHLAAWRPTVSKDIINRNMS